MKEFWNERYAQKVFAYGAEPNLFFKEQLNVLEPGTILLPAEGEGRNAVYAAKSGWQVTAFDISEQGKLKADQLASQQEVSINYSVGPLEEMTLNPDHFDTIGLIYAHFPAHLKSKYHQALDRCLRPGGTIIFEAFSKSHLEYNTKNPAAGGPKNIDMLFSIEEIKQDFETYDIIELEEKVIELNEGLYHLGTSAVIRFVGRKR